MAKKSECSIVDFRRDIPHLLARVEFVNERIVITKNGKPKAALISMRDLALLETIKKTTKQFDMFLDEAALTPSQLDDYAAMAAKINGPQKLTVVSQSATSLSKNFRGKKAKK